MDIDIIRMAHECPGLIISVSVADLVEANNQLITDTKRELELSIARRDNATFLTREKVMEKLSIAPSTLWRWQKSGYLVPINVGGQRRYKSTDINDILEGRK